MPLLEHLVLIDLGEELRHARQQGGEEPARTRVASARRRGTCSVFSARNAGSLPARSSSMNVTPPDVPMPGMAGGEKAKAWASATPASRWFSSSHDHVGREPVLVPRVPVVQRDEVEPVVGRRHQAQQAEAGHAGVVLDARRRLEDGVELVVDGRGAVERRGQGKLDVDVEIALILVGDEAAGKPGADEAGERRPRRARRSIEKADLRIRWPQAPT